ncbi:methyltransferase domain-containing protein [Pelagibacteraceae bacterium]|nr:methyltransferase domain-containing protein [Pelagibacteraceae bacterium]
MSLTDINLREKKFHNKLQSKSKGRFENTFYKALYNMYEDFSVYISKKANNKIVLDYGCGTGNITQKIAASSPLKLFGIDISDVSINKAIENAKNSNLQIDYSVDNCEETKFKSEKFDLVFGSGILHHLNLERSVGEINRILKKNGEMVFLEPLGTNPLINFYRKLTPESRSEDEHPFLKKDFDFIESLFEKITIKYYGFFTLVFFLFYKNPQKSLIFKIISKLDYYFFKIKYFKKFAWSVLIIAKKN